MYRYKRPAIIFNLTDSDSTLVRYANMVSRMLQSEKVYFIHVTDKDVLILQPTRIVSRKGYNTPPKLGA